MWFRVIVFTTFTFATGFLLGLQFHRSYIARKKYHEDNVKEYDDAYCVCGLHKKVYHEEGSVYCRKCGRNLLDTHEDWVKGTCKGCGVEVYELSLGGLCTVCVDKFVDGGKDWECTYCFHHNEGAPIYSGGVIVCSNCGKIKEGTV